MKKLNIKIFKIYFLNEKFKNKDTLCVSFLNSLKNRPVLLAFPKIGANIIAHKGEKMPPVPSMTLNR